MNSNEQIPQGAAETQLNFYDHISPDSNAPEPRIELPRPDFFVKKARPVLSHAFATYWQFATKRQEIFYKKVFNKTNGVETSDPILLRYRFTNVYRASDRVSQYLIRHVLYDKNWSPIDLAFRLLIFKFFNKIETWEALVSQFGEVSWSLYRFDLYDKCLSNILARGERIYSPAYIMPSGRTAFGYERKHKNHLKIIEKMIHDDVGNRLAEMPSFEATYLLLRNYPCVGPFLGYQLAIDFNYSEVMDFSENDFVEPGPGAIDGITKCFGQLGDYSYQDIIKYCTEAQDDAFQIFAPDFENLWGRKLHLIDCQNLFCEVGKYARVAHPNLAGVSRRTRIKQTYRGASRGSDRPWYPPKWGINQQIDDDPRWVTN